jgi:rRNA maturation RNase YbeY
MRTHPRVQEMPVTVLGDIVISLNTAARQAAERRAAYGDTYGVRTEARVLLLHGLLHLLGFDHEAGPEAAEDMARQEVALLEEVGWEGKGLVEMAALGEGGLIQEGVEDDGALPRQSALSASARACDVRLLERGWLVSQHAPGPLACPSRQPCTSARKRSRTGGASAGSSMSAMEMVRAPKDIKLVLMDMDGTLLNSESKITERTARAIMRCLQQGDVTLMVATGKARPAAYAAFEPVGLSGAILASQPQRYRCCQALKMTSMSR